MIVEGKFCAARIPDKRRAVVPELPAFKYSEGLLKPLNPFPFTFTYLSSKTISVPSLRKQFIVELISAESNRL